MSNPKRITLPGREEPCLQVSQRAHLDGRPAFCGGDFLCHFENRIIFVGCAFDVSSLDLWVWIYIFIFGILHLRILWELFVVGAPCRILRNCFCPDTEMVNWPVNGFPFGWVNFQRVSHWRLTPLQGIWSSLCIFPDFEGLKVLDFLCLWFKVEHLTGSWD